MNSDKLYFKNLDSIRFIAALTVYLAHGISPSYQFLPIQNYFLRKLLYTISNGALGVSIFFVLSGFLITYLLISEYELNSKIALLNFYIRRALRIWPLYFLVVAFAFVLYPYLDSLIRNHIPFAANVYYHLAFLSNFDLINISKYGNNNGALAININWSVSIEEQFYLFWPLIFVFLSKRFWIYGILLVIAGSICFRIINHADIIILYFHTFSALINLGIGGLMAYLIKENGKIRSFFENCSSWTHLILIISSLCLVFGFDFIFSFENGIAIGQIFVAISFALIISAQAITKTKSKLNLGNIAFANRWGKYTYGIYLLHPIALTIMDLIAVSLNIPKTNFINTFSFGILGFVLTLFLSKISYKYYESRFLLLKDKFTTIKTHIYISCNTKQV